MSNRRYAIMCLRLGLLASAIFAGFWGVWHLLGYQVPVTAHISLEFSSIITANTIQTFNISRWWDVPLAFLFINMQGWLLRAFSKIIKYGDDNGMYYIALAILTFGVNLGLAWGAVVGILSGLIVGLFSGIVMGLSIFFCIGLIIGLPVSFVDLILRLFSHNLWKSIHNWFVAKNIS